jgi:hypothetical protein
VYWRCGPVGGRGNPTTSPGSFQKEIMKAPARYLRPELGHVRLALPGPTTSFDGMAAVGSTRVSNDGEGGI